MNRTLPTAMAAAVLLTISGCALFGRGGNDTVSSYYKYKPLFPPSANAIGRELIQDGILGPAKLFEVTETNIVRDAAINSLTQTTYDSYEANLDLAIQQAALNVGATYSGTKTTKGTKLEVLYLNNLGQEVVPERTFVYQCITASSSVISLSSKTKAGAALDISKFAQAYGVDVAKFKVGADPDKPDTLEVSIQNPDVCLGYVSARFVDDNGMWWWRIDDKYVNFSVGFGKDLKNVTELSAGQATNPRSPQFVGKEPPNKPQYWIEVAKSAVDPTKLELKTCSSQFATSRAPVCKTREQRGGQGVWNGRYFVEAYSYATNRWKVISIDLNAAQQGDKVVINYARMMYPQYELEVQ